ncbi:hypothetical protein K9N68_29020 [Kovacikia minuta CCNUW1]|uniref:hypothetical protein n=1 Tax=Kovacikia minuta TaxID=2931930 RepID=UPI001CCFCA29|nr:hypothetical protein [Kovacikia minuta]UBF25574.1 hypothetical protein K9N68_29020 [Kovacikia minuta CCNUW1]
MHSDLSGGNTERIGTEPRVVNDWASRSPVNMGVGCRVWGVVIANENGCSWRISSNGSEFLSGAVREVLQVFTELYIWADEIDDSFYRGRQKAEGRG